jgi:hypothetical protein
MIFEEVLACVGVDVGSEEHGDYLGSKEESLGENHGGEASRGHEAVVELGLGETELVHEAIALDLLLTMVVGLTAHVKARRRVGWVGSHDADEYTLQVCACLRLCVCTRPSSQHLLLMGWYILAMARYTFANIDHQTRLYNRLGCITTRLGCTTEMGLVQALAMFAMIRRTVKRFDTNCMS